MTSKTDQALRHFKSVLHKAIEIEHESIRVLSHYRLAEMYLLKSEESKAKTHFKKVDTVHLSVNELKEYRKTAQKLGIDTASSQEPAN